MMFLEEAIRKTGERMKEFSKEVQRALRNSPSQDAREATDREFPDFVTSVRSISDEEREKMIQEMRMRMPLIQGRVHLPHSRQQTEREEGKRVDFSEFMDSRRVGGVDFALTSAPDTPGSYIMHDPEAGETRTVFRDPMPRPQEFQLTNDLYHLIIDCTEIILEYCRTNNKRPDYNLAIRRNGRIDIRIGMHNCIIASKNELQILEDFLRRVYG